MNELLAGIEALPHPKVAGAQGATYGAKVCPPFRREHEEWNRNPGNAEERGERK